MQSAEGLSVINGGLADPDVADKAASVVGSKAWASKMRRRAKELAKTLDMGYMELARILYQVYDTPVDGDSRRGAVYTAWGYSNFGEYAEKELGLHQKKAERLRLIWYCLEVQLADMPSELKERVVNLGYSKVRELVRVLTMRNAQDWIERSEHMTYRQLYSAVIDEKRRQGVEEALLEAGEGGEKAEASAGESPEPELGAEPPEEPSRRESFELFPLQRANVLLALQKACELGHTDKRGQALDLICTDFLATNDIMGGDLDKRLRYVAKIERTLGLKLVAIDPEANDIVYGVQSLKLVTDS